MESYIDPLECAQDIKNHIGEWKDTENDFYSNGSLQMMI
jgi:hypothetical protein